MAVNVDALAKQILTQAISTGGEIWTRIKTAAPIYVKGYAKVIVDIASGVTKGGITPADGKLFARNALLILIQGITYACQVTYVQVERFINRVIEALKGTVNAALPIPLL